MRLIFSIIALSIITISALSQKITDIVNIMGNDTYERKIINSEFITHTVNRLRPREFIIKYSFSI